MNNEPLGLQSPARGSHRGPGGAPAHRQTQPPSTAVQV